MTTIRIHERYSLRYTPVRVFLALVLYVVAMVLTWPVTLLETAMIAVGCALLASKLTVDTDVEVEG